ncbi:MAG: DEAD/DEAH box helicase [Candidatus Krumholzibacteria bacterium]|nr:DEAD/DEAH box helicase [Candidatus Krumholzibacteria bacterium]
MSEPVQGFSELELAAPLVKAVIELGYEAPLPIQAACIPPLLAGRDVLGLAQTGTGKTGAFALPLLSNIDLSVRAPQVLVLTPTRELAIQVAEAFQAYARHLRDFHVLPIYGGQRYSFQFSQLHRGPHVIVGTPGRIQDHLNRGTLNLGNIKTVVLDEADEMLRMGFVEEVEAIISHAPDVRQMALFSATMPTQIKRISKRYMKDPVEVRIEAATTTAENIEQVYLVAPNAAKFEVLARILETESYDGIIIFTRTRLGTTELAGKLAARGFDVAALNGEMTQVLRERTIKRLKSGNIDILVATDVAARGLDVHRISLVINYDIPGDPEAYIHRIGRTGRVGRYGKAILFANPRERRLLSSIERATRQPLKPMEMPSHDTVTAKRVEKFREALKMTMAKESMTFFQTLSYELMEEMNVDILQLAAGLLCHAQKDRPLQAENSRALENQHWDDSRGNQRGRDRDRSRGGERDRGPVGGGPMRNMALYRLAVGSLDGVEVRNIVGAVANETGLRSRFIGQIRIHPKYSTIELPDDLPRGMIEHLKGVQFSGKPLNISRTRAENHYGHNPDEGRVRPPAQDRPAPPRPAVEKPVASKPAASKPAATKPVATKPAADKSASDAPKPKKPKKAKPKLTKAQKAKAAKAANPKKSKSGKPKSTPDKGKRRKPTGTS